MNNWPLIRDVGLFMGGVAGVAHETLIQHTERPTLLILFAAMMGLPAFLQGGPEIRKREQDGEKSKRSRRQREE